MFSAVEEGNVDKVAGLLRNGADANACDESRAGVTALHLAVRHKHVEVMDMLLTYGANKNARGPWNFTPLMYAIIFHNETAVERLVTIGADIDATDAKGHDALAHAEREKNDFAMQLLRSRSIT